MNDEAESSGTAQRHASTSSEPAALGADGAPVDQEEVQWLKDELKKERRLDAKRKRIRMLNELLRELDLIVYMQLITVYQIDCSFFWMAVKALIHGTLLTPTADPMGEQAPDEPKPFLPLMVFSFCVNFVLHQFYSAPSAGEDTRGYLHGGLLIDFIGQKGPTSKWKLGALDVCVLSLQLVMVSVHIKRRELKKKLASLSAGMGSTASDVEGSPSDASEAARETLGTENATRDQNADDEERGILRRTDTLSDVGAEFDEEDARISSSSEARQADALDILTSGQCSIGDFSLIDTLMQENKNYSAYRLTRAESGVNDMPETLRRLNTLRTRFGVGGG
ncbi:hypothetical protein ACEQ8H_007159 [Pleosporales sp. CAS-2024a]